MESASHRLYVGSEPDRYFVPPYVGQHGWIGVHLDRVEDWDDLADLIAESYRMTAPKRLLAHLGDQPQRHRGPREGE